MSLFQKEASYLGIDLGTASIKLAELGQYKKRPRLLTYGFSEKKLSGSGIEENILNDPNEVAKMIKEISAKAKTSSKKAVASLPNFSVFTSILHLPNLPKKELASAITWEAKKIIPMPIEDIILDWKIISAGDEKNDKQTKQNASLNLSDGKDTLNKIEPLLEDNKRKILSSQKKDLKILLTGAGKKLVNQYLEVFNKAGLNLVSLETESFALIRSLIGNDKSAIMLVDLGANTSSVTMVDKGVPVVNRSIEIGGNMITRSISGVLNVNIERAEKFKQDLSLDMEAADNSLPQLVEKSLSPIINEIKYTLGLFQEQYQRKVEKIILTGGGAGIGNLSGYLAKIMNVNTYVGDPWARVVTPTELKPVLDRLGPKFAVGVGLAMRNL